MDSEHKLMYMTFIRLFSLYINNNAVYSYEIFKTLYHYPFSLNYVTCFSSSLNTILYRFLNPKSLQKNNISPVGENSVILTYFTRLPRP